MATRLCSHTHMSGNVLGSLHFHDQFCLWKSLLIFRPKFCCSGVWALVLSYAEGLQVFLGCEGGQMSHLFSIPDPKSLSFIHPGSTQAQRYNLYRAEWSSYVLPQFYECGLKITLTLTANTSVAPVALLHSCVPLLLKSMHDQLCTVTSSCIQHLLISVKPFAQCFQYLI